MEDLALNGQEVEVKIHVYHRPTSVSCARGGWSGRWRPPSVEQGNAHASIARQRRTVRFIAKGA
jgi:hypothetical protein